MSLAARLLDAASGGAVAVEFDDAANGASHDEKIIRQLRQDERELLEQVAQMRAELKRRRDDAPTRKQKSKKIIIIIIIFFFFFLTKALRQSVRWPMRH